MSAVLHTSPAATPRRVRVGDLADLATVFPLLESGVSVVLAVDASPEETPAAPPLSPDAVRLGLRTSGTTGTPALVWHPWSELRNSGVPGGGREGWTWASPFRPDSFAGVQVALQAWLTGGRCLSLAGDWAEVWSCLARTRPEALCCTPTFLDLLLVAEGAGWSRLDWVPRQITLGGEPLRARVGQSVRSRFPETRLTVVYATTEIGVVAKTHRHDGWFETASLLERWKEWRVVDEELQVRGAAGWLPTGDRVELVGEAMRVLGRASAIANVGGTKVVLPDLEKLAEDVPGVQAVKAWAAPSAVTGHIVAIKFSVLPGADAASVHEMLERHLRSRLPKEAWPRRWEFVPAACGPNAKILL